MGSALLQLRGEKEEQQRPVFMQIRIPYCWRQRQTEWAEERGKAEHKMSLVDFVASAPSNFGSIE